MIATVRSVNPIKAFFLFVLSFACFCATSASSQNSVPQVVLTDEIVQRIETQRAADQVFAADYQALIDSAEAHLQSPTIVEAVRNGDGQLHEAFRGFGQRPVERLTTLALAWRLTGDSRYVDRARTELLQFSELETWQPAHFLGLSRVTLAVSLGYSWISDNLDEEDHQTIRSALVEKGLKEAAKIYDLDRLYYDKGWVAPQRWVNPVSVPASLPDGTATADIAWPVASFNWNIVCNAGMIVAALVVSETEPELADHIIKQAQVSLRNGLAMFAPDGAWPEGPMYGALSARDAAVGFDALVSVLGHDFDLSKMVGLEEFGEFLIHASGPTGMLFNFGDSDTSTDLVVLTWLASRFNRPGYDLKMNSKMGSSHPAFELIWQQRRNSEPTTARSTSYWSGGLGIVTMRSGWNDPKASYIGLKAGPLSSHHNDLDAGTFVLEADGVRWGVDLGLGNYQLPGYFTDKRFDYYRTATIGQNTLTFDMANQIETGRAHVEELAQFPGFDFAIADLSDAYGKPKGTVRRGIALVDGTTVLVQDEISPDQRGRVAWAMHTEAQLTVDGSKATLRQDGKELTARILSPPNATFSQLSANPCETAFNSECAMQNPNSGVTRLMIQLDLDESDKRETIVVTFEPDAQAANKPVIPLGEWRLNATLSNDVEKKHIDRLPAEDSR